MIVTLDTSESTVTERRDADREQPKDVKEVLMK
jgi:hypothetical protein